MRLFWASLGPQMQQFTGYLLGLSRKRREKPYFLECSDLQGIYIIIYIIIYICKDQSKWEVCISTYTRRHYRHTHTESQMYINIINTSHRKIKLEYFRAHPTSSDVLSFSAPSAYNDSTVFWSRPGILDTMCRLLGCDFDCSVWWIEI